MILLPTTNYKLQTQSGYIALMSAIIISILLLAITVGLGFNGFFGRLNIVDSDSKERSSALAEACVDVAILKLVSDKDYVLTPADQNIQIGNNPKNICSIMSLSPIPRTFPITIQTQSNINKAFTNLEVIVDNNFEITSWQELANF